ncbi:hypothetical protein G6514_002681 [Epicoccum nigrum]|nr:hypothetical protein G6514_002681 [Epicoccum nigrum]
MPEPLAAWDAASSIPTLTGSLLSLFATALVILLWIFAGGKKRRDFRYALILNLTVAEFLNCLNNSVSGIAAVIRRRPLSPGLACQVNGWGGQLSVQAVDFSILAISLVTLLTIQLRSFIIYASTTTKALICLSIWIVPLYTSIFAWVKGYYGPVSGNWCWIESRYLRQRYSLNHGWRFAIILISICTYVYVFTYMSRRLRPQGISNLSSSIPDDLDMDYAKIEDRPRDHAVLAGCGSTPRLSLYNVDMSRQKGTVEGHTNESDDCKASVTFEKRTAPTSEGNAAVESNNASPALSQNHASETPQHIQKKRRRATSSFSFARAGDHTSHFPANNPIHLDLEKSLSPIPPPAPSPFPFRRASHAQTKARIDRDIWKMLLLNMYPVTYLILWLPGIANRIAEGMGYNVHALVVLQSSTQFIGAANAAGYLWKEHGRDVGEWWRGLRERRGRVRENREGVGEGGEGV